MSNCFKSPSLRASEAIQKAEKRWIASAYAQGASADFCPAQLARRAKTGRR
jgi:hypothetical protein